MISLLNDLNPIFWIVSNLLIAYIGVILLFFVSTYALLFDPSATTAGKLVFRFTLSLVGVIGLVFIGVFINPTAVNEWWEYPGDVFWWRPIVRSVVYGYVAYTVTSLWIFLFLRKFKPHRLKTAPDLELVVPRKFN